MGRWRGPIMLISAAVLALIVTLLVYNLVKQKGRVREKVVALSLKPVVAAIVDLSWGTKLSKDLLTVVSLPEKDLPGGYYSSIDDVIGRVLITKVVANEPILESKLAPIGTKAGLPGLIDENKRGVSVAVDQVVGVAGFIQPGSNVDVLVTVRAMGEMKEPITKIVLQNVPVLAIGTQIETKEGETIPVNVVTLEVSPKDAEKLAHAANEGKIRLAMRHSLDDKFVRTAGATVSELIPYYRTREKPFGKGISVVVIRGTTISTEIL